VLQLLGDHTIEWFWLCYMLCVGAHFSHRVNQLYKIRNINITFSSLLDFTTSQMIHYSIN